MIINLTEDEIFKAIQCCTDSKRDCKHCPLLHFSSEGDVCQKELMRQSSVLIKYKNTEIERLMRRYHNE